MAEYLNERRPFVNFVLSCLAGFTYLKQYVKRHGWHNLQSTALSAYCPRLSTGGRHCLLRRSNTFWRWWNFGIKLRYVARHSSAIDLLRNPGIICGQAEVFSRGEGCMQSEDRLKNSTFPASVTRSDRDTESADADAATRQCFGYLG